MRATASLPLVLATIVAAVPAQARDRAVAIDVPAGSAGEAIRVLGRQGRVSIGFRDARLTLVPVRAVRGTLTPLAALDRLLSGTAMRARRVAPSSFVIERAPTRARVAATPTARPRPAPLPEDEPVAADIVVTASKRGVPLDLYAGGAQVIEGDRLSLAEAARGTNLIESRAASVTSTHLGPGRNKLFIRGIADSSFVGPTQATVGQYWGNSRITYSAPDPSLRLYDVKSVEVLEGPQGTLYGAGSLGGLVRVVPNAPDLGVAGGHVWAGAQAVQHGDVGVDGGAVLNLPLVSDMLGLRVLGFGGVDSGYIDDRGRGLDDVNRVVTAGGRATLRLAPGNGWTVDLTGLGQRIRGDDSQYADRVEDGLSRDSSIAQPYRNDYWLADLVVRKSWGALEWSSSIGYANQRVFEQFEGPELFDVFSPGVAPRADAPRAAFTQDNRIEMVTAETRLSRRGDDGGGWLLAASTLGNTSRVARQMRDPGMRSPLTGVRNRVEEQTLYGEYAIVPLARTTLTLGGRLTRTELGGESRDVLRTVALRVDPNASNRREETRFLPSAALSWRPNDSVTLFARYQQGFRPGGIAVRQDYIQRFDGDRVSTAEAGARIGGNGFDLALNLSYTRWRDIQADIVDGFGFPTTANIGDGQIWSVGGSGRWRPVPGLEIDAALYINDSRVTRTAFTILPVSTGAIDASRLPNVADRSGRLGFTYSGGLSDRLSFDLTGYGRYIGQSSLGVGSILGRLQGDYLDTGLELRVGDGRRGVSLTATNLLDSRGNRFALGSPFLIRDEQHITPLQPRSVRVGVDWVF
ncbi:Outer membrane receptor proteins, mostly Fe transport [Sphingomonas guangdongensis]|uniref:Outer membrane receptor proteins, mostly Fe transport n=1 Tax=Sphingomonas guangdongensis TaxID=1141890 RepID=A0A285QBJ9_9SPHN|nr:TonB-dependent receptor [Sphingomonas guangdongensis]SOB79191.1 Outer membrane receptor proteins, mostly Fe transport [Sphingomonas guangdongensis]